MRVDSDGGFALLPDADGCWPGQTVGPNAGCRVLVIAKGDKLGARHGSLTVSSSPGGTVSVELASEVL